MGDRTWIPYGRQHLDEDDIRAVVDVLQSNWITQGPAIERFERAVADYCGARYAVAVSSATGGLHLACQAAGLEAGDILWTSPNTFVASANCGRYCGAEVDFVDIDPATYNMSVEALATRLEQAERANRLPKVLIPVHFSGQACRMAEISELAKQYGITVIEDAAHAIGAAYKDQPVGRCDYADMTVFSFHPVKIITTGEGGMVLTNRPDLYERLLRLRSHGITREPAQLQAEPHGPWYYEQVELGYHYRMTDIQAALGESQMRRLDTFIAERRRLAARYDALLEGLAVIRPWQHPDTRSSYHLYPIQVDEKQAGRSRQAVFEAMREAGIGVQVHYIPVHTQPYYRQRGFDWGDFPVAEAYYRAAFSLPLYYGLTEAEQDRVVDALAGALSGKALV